MLTISKLNDNFYPVEELEGGIIRCGDELPKKTIYTYFMLSQGSEDFTLTVSENVIADDFALLVMRTGGFGAPSQLAKEELPTNQYGFTHLLRVPPNYHSELKGRLDSDRIDGTLCIPIYRSEFSGNEEAEEFIELRRNVVPTNHWERQVAPKIVFRFDNPKTGSGTGENYVFAKFDLVLRELENLVGVPNGFIELLNYKQEVVELTYQGETDFAWIPGRDDASAERMQRDAIRERLWTFLTR